MTSSAVVSAVRELKPRFFEGLAPAEVKLILQAATQRRFLQSSVITYQAHPGDHLFLLLHGRARYFYMTQEGQKILPSPEAVSLIRNRHQACFSVRH